MSAVHLHRWTIHDSARLNTQSLFTPAPPPTLPKNPDLVCVFPSWVFSNPALTTSTSLAAATSDTNFGRSRSRGIYASQKIINRLSVLIWLACGTLLRGDKDYGPQNPKTGQLWRGGYRGIRPGGTSQPETTKTGRKGCRREETREGTRKGLASYDTERYTERHTHTERDSVWLHPLTHSHPIRIPPLTPTTYLTFSTVQVPPHLHLLQLTCIHLKHPSIQVGFTYPAVSQTPHLRQYQPLPTLKKKNPRDHSLHITSSNNCDSLPYSTEP